MSLGIFMQSCSRYDYVDDIPEHSMDGANLKVADFKTWFKSQTIASEFVGTQEPDWDNAEITTMPDGKTLHVSIEIYKGKNSVGNDSVRKLQIAAVENGFTGGVKVFSFYNSEYAHSNYYSLTGRILEEGRYYAPNQVDMLLKRYTIEWLQVRLKDGTEADDLCSDTVWVPNSATPLENSDGSANSAAYNCHYYAWSSITGNNSGPGCSVPGSPNWYNSPNIYGSGYSAESIPQVGDIWVSYGYVSGLGAGAAVHSAVVKEVVNGKVTKVQAKCGQDGICTYNPDCSEFGQYKTGNIQYFRKAN
jgi:hypothetical protein